MHIETSRLIIRNFEEKDAAGLYEYLAAPPVYCFYSEKVNSYDEAVKKVKEKQNGDDHGNCYAVCLRDTDFIIGEVFAMKEHPDTYSVGWNFNLKYGKKGYAADRVRTGTL
ncbi:GNAT family N-acetyltransferase [Lacrimispora sp. 38-1]|uniref:GNAT family N-acetyltransferase n=1 Tax=Lacrimispora sp. 38-1 TaxID=3125778 RepID=UPI003CEFDCA4